MSGGNGLSRQSSDLLAYVLFPLLCLLTPASLSRWVMRCVSGWGFLLRADAELALDGARRHLEITDEKAWKRRWKQVEMLDARDLYMLHYGRARSVLAEIEVPEDFGIARDRVMVGMHWGPAISILKLLADAGMQPTFPFRPPERALRRQRPFYYLYTVLATRYLASTLGDRAVTTGGAGKRLAGLLEVPGSICVLMDAPVEEGRPSMVRDVLGMPAVLNTGFPDTFIGRGKEYVLYAMSMADDGTALKNLELKGPYRAGNTDEYLDQFALQLDRHLAADSAQWRIWRAQHQVWRDSA